MRTDLVVFYGGCCGSFRAATSEEPNGHRGESVPAEGPDSNRDKKASAMSGLLFSMC